MLRAMAFLDGLVATASVTHTYVFLDDVLQQSIADQPPDYLFDVADYDMDPRVVNDPLYSATIKDDLKAIPTLSIVTDVDHLFGPQNGIYTHRSGRGDAWERPTSVELFSAGSTAQFQINCGIRIQGGVSRLSKIGKYSLRLLFKSLYGPSKLVYPFFPDRRSTASTPSLSPRSTISRGRPAARRHSTFATRGSRTRSSRWAGSRATRRTSTST